MALVIGIDSSTQSTKAVAHDLVTGAVVAAGSAPHPATAPPVSEQDPEAWWAALVDAVGQLGDARAEVVAVSVAGQQHGLVLLDGADRPVRPAKLWNDTTSAPDADALVERLGADTWADRCGSVPVASFTVTKLAWTARNEPDALERATKVMLPHDYLTWRLTGEHVTDRGDVSGTGWFDPSNDRYRGELLAAATEPVGVSLDCPTVLAPTQRAGTLTPTAAAELGLPSGVVVGPGTGDNMGAALGLGLSGGDVAVSLGTSGTVYAVSTIGTSDATGAVAGFADATGRFLPLVCTLNATVVTDTVAAWLGTDAPGLSALAAEVAATNGGDEELALVPYFDGERTPNLPDAAGTWFGLRRTTTRAQLARAAHDGVLCGLLQGLDRLVDGGVTADGTLHLIGGGARAAAYRQRCADLHGRPIVVPEADEAVATGAALQAAAVHQSADLGSLASAWGLGAGAVVEPVSDDGPDRRAVYAARAAMVADG
ncbi:MAG: xylulokinase [Actinomycetota bacterium]